MPIKKWWEIYNDETLDSENNISIDSVDSKAEANHFMAALLEAGIVQYTYAELCTYSGSQKSSLFCFCTFIYLFFPISGEDFDEDLNQSDG